MILGRGLERAEWAPARQTFALSRLIGILALSRGAARTRCEKLYLNMARYQNAFEIHAAAILMILVTALYAALALRTAAGWPAWTIAPLLALCYLFAPLLWNVITVLNWAVVSLFRRDVRQGTNLRLEQFLCNFYVTAFSVWAAVRVPSFRIASWLWLTVVAANGIAAFVLLFLRSTERRLNEDVERTFRFDA